MKIKKVYIFLCSFMCLMVLSGCGYLGPGNADFHYDLSGKYKLFHSQGNFIFMEGGTEVAVDLEVIGIAWNDDFILAEQKINNTSNYWIIDVKNNKIYGPLNTASFDTKRSELKIDQTLKLEKPEKYKYLDPSIKANK